MRSRKAAIFSAFATETDEVEKKARESIYLRHNIISIIIFPDEI